MRETLPLGPELERLRTGTTPSQEQPNARQAQVIDVPKEFQAEKNSSRRPAQVIDVPAELRRSAKENKGGQRAQELSVTPELLAEIQQRRQEETDARAAAVLQEHIRRAPATEIMSPPQPSTEMDRPTQPATPTTKGFWNRLFGK